MPSLSKARMRALCGSAPLCLAVTLFSLSETVHKSEMLQMYSRWGTLPLIGSLGS